MYFKSKVNNFLAGFIYQVLASYRCLFSLFHFQFCTFSISISHSFHNVVLNRRHLFMCIGSIFNLGFFFIKQERFILTPIDLKPCLLDAMTYFSWSFKRFEMNILFNWTKSLNWIQFTWLDRSYIFYSGWLYAWPLLFNAYLRYLKRTYTPTFEI